MRRFMTAMGAVALSTGIVLAPQVFAQAQPKPSLAVLSPSNGDIVTSTDIPVSVQVSNFTLSTPEVGMPDKDGEGHIHVMLDGMNMGVLFPRCFLTGRVTGAIRAGCAAAFVARPNMVLDPAGEQPHVVGTDLWGVAGSIVGREQA